jgi:predicted lipid-binding transport protein (Tim44 family)
MKALATALAVFLTLGLAAVDAEAKRMGGGRSMGMQRSTPPQAAPQAPTQQAAPAAAPAATPAAPATGASRWLGPLAGLALGAGLASLFMNNGLAGAFAGLLMIAAIVAVAFMVMRLVRSRAAPRPMQYAGAAAGPVETRFEPVFGSGGAPAPAAAAGLPADFDAESFLRHARLNFVRLQAAHDAGDLSALREVMTPELFAEIDADLKSAGPAGGKTEVVTLKGDVLDVTTDAERYIVSVRFSGLIRENAGAEAAPFAEIWHLEKPARGKSGWLLAGIQQEH